jgi:hypothetical protein
MSQDAPSVLLAKDEAVRGTLCRAACRAAMFRRRAARVKPGVCWRISAPCRGVESRFNRLKTG